MKLSKEFTIFDEEFVRETEPEKCIGLVFRAIVNKYSYIGQIGDNKKLRLLKRKSCTGCESCDYVYEYFNEMPEYICLDDIEHGKMYVPVFEGGVDYESGIWELDNISFVEVKNEKNKS